MKDKTSLNVTEIINTEEREISVRQISYGKPSKLRQDRPNYGLIRASATLRSASLAPKISTEVKHDPHPSPGRSHSKKISHAPSTHTHTHTHTYTHNTQYTHTKQKIETPFHFWKGS
jgi:hypothetical protein